MCQNADRDLSLHKQKEFVMSNVTKIFDKPKMTLSDLRRLGRQGGAILILEDGRQAQIRPDYAITRKRQWQNGQCIVREEILPFHRIYSVIIIVKRKHLVIAERVTRKGEKLLVLTGVGYHRPNHYQRR